MNDELQREEQITILYVDDNEDDHLLFRRAIGRSCPVCVLLEANDPKQAFQLLREHIPNVIITDGSFHMADGPSFIHQLRTTYPRIPVVALSGRSDQSTIDRAYDAGASAYFVKPGNFDAYLNTIAIMSRFLMGLKLPTLP